jgi:soluble lytic murein transglycosylase
MNWPKNWSKNLRKAGARRLILLGFASAGALTVAVGGTPLLDRLQGRTAALEDRLARLSWFGGGSWRDKRGSIEDALRDFLGPAPAPSAQRTEAGLFPEGEAPATPLAAYAPANGWPKPAPGDPPRVDPAALIGKDFEPFARALAAYRASDFGAGDAALTAAESSLPVAAAQWAALKLHPREAGFERISRFLEAHPDWPAADWLRRRAEESLYADRHPDAAIKAFFAQSRPLTAPGKLALARALGRDGDFVRAAELVRDVWREDELSDWLEGVVRKDFAELLAPADLKFHADRLLYAGKNGAGVRAAELLGKDVALLARARAAANRDAASEKLFATVSPALQNDPGLIFARARMLRKAEKISEAAAVMLTAPVDPERVVDGDAWWEERRLLARKLLDRGDAANAYLVSAGHAARKTSAKVEAEFHAGWIALRFLGDPAMAERHFARLAQISETPIQKSRAAYWRGRAAEAERSPESDARARAFYADAATHSTTFYGQLAQAKLGSEARPLRPAPAAAQGDARDEAVRVVELLLANGDKDIAAPLAADAAKRLQSEAQVAALGAVVERFHDAKLSLVFGKLASYRGVALDDVAFPDYGVPHYDALAGSASRSIVFAIARQESAFDPKAVSSAGAMGLMQMIASTARHTAYQTGVGFTLSRMLSEPAFNARLGAAHLGILLKEYRGSYPLAFAAYNAGGKRVKEWIDAYGDPRRPEVDPVDWIERISITETRNYVQRVMENFVVYRAKFNDFETRAPQTDLARAEGGS